MFTPQSNKDKLEEQWAREVEEWTRTLQRHYVRYEEYRLLYLKTKKAIRKADRGQKPQLYNMRHKYKNQMKHYKDKVNEAEAKILMYQAKVDSI